MTSAARVALALAALLVLTARPAGAHDLTPSSLQSVGFTQHPGAQIPRDLLFRDDDGQPARLGDYLGRGPVVLTLNDLQCANLCPLELDGVINGLNGLSFVMGEQYTLLTVSINPRDGPAEAVSTKQRGLRAYVHPNAAAGWHILTGDHDTIDRLTTAVGFDYVYDLANDDFAHPAGLIVVTPGGTVSHYLFGIDFATNDIRLALVDAANQHIGSLLDRVALICYHYDPSTGRYTPFVLGLLQIAAAATLVVVGGGLVILWRADVRRQHRQRSNGEV